MALLLKTSPGSGLSAFTVNTRSCFAHASTSSDHNASWCCWVAGFGWILLSAQSNHDELSPGDHPHASTFRADLQAMTFGIHCNTAA